MERRGKGGREKGKTERERKHIHIQKLRTPTATILYCFKIYLFLDPVIFTIKVFSLIDSVFVLLQVKW